MSENDLSIRNVTVNLINKNINFKLIFNLYVPPSIYTHEPFDLSKHN